MPAFTLSSTIASILQFLAVMVVLSVVINTHTTSGAGVIPINIGVNCTAGPLGDPTNAMCVGSSLNGTINLTSQNYLSTSNQNSLTVQMGKVYAGSNNINTGILQQFGGLAFIPAAFGAFMDALWNIPKTAISVFEMAATFNGSYIPVLPFSAMMLSGILMAYYVTEFVFKMLTPITKVEVGDI